MEEIAKYIVTELKYNALSLCNGDKFMADDLVQDTALKCLKYFTVNPDIPFEQQQKIAWVCMKRLRYDMYDRSKSVKNIKVVCDVPYWISDEQPAEYEKNVKDMYNFVRNSDNECLETFFIYLNGYRYNDIAAGKKRNLNTISGHIRYAKEKIRSKFFGEKVERKNYYIPKKTKPAA